MPNDEHHDALTDYQIARRNGYRFSEQRWLESLKGERGDRGEKGDRGERGPRGLNGENGRDGKDGRDGIDGKAGTAGRDGVDGSMPDPMPWTATFERGSNRLTRTLRIKGSDGSSWQADVLRDTTGLIAEVQITPL